MGGLFFFTNIHGLMVVNPHKLGYYLHPRLGDGQHTGAKDP
jgi:hypothetical protein